MSEIDRINQENICAAADLCAEPGSVKTEPGKVLCGANSYVQKYYFNDEFAALPIEVKKELQIACVMFTEEVGGVLTMEFSPEGKLLLKCSVDDADYLYDNIESELQIRRLTREKEKLFGQLEQFYYAKFIEKCI